MNARELLDIVLFRIGNTAITLSTLVIFVIIVTATFVLSHLLQRATVQAFKLRGITREGTVGVTRRLLHYTIIIIGLGIALQTVGIDLSALFAAGAIFAIGLGFAMQNIAQNFVSGLILLLERTIKPGDILRVEGQLVKVRQMGIRATIARTLDDEEVIVPNSVVVQSTVTNYTLKDSLYRLRCEVGVVYGSDMRKVRETLGQVARTTPWRFTEKEPVVLLTGFGSSSVDWEVSVWIEDPWNMRRWRSQLYEAIWWALKREEIVIAFPQLDLHLDAPVVEALGR